MYKAHKENNIERKIVCEQYTVIVHEVYKEYMNTHYNEGFARIGHNKFMVTTKLRIHYNSNILHNIIQ